jgi:hypothetical protein
MCKDLAPAGVLEGSLVEDLINIIWRKRRVIAHESALILDYQNRVGCLDVAGPISTRSQPDGWFTMLCFTINNGCPIVTNSYYATCCRPRCLAPRTPRVSGGDGGGSDARYLQPTLVVRLPCA